MHIRVGDDELHERDGGADDADSDGYAPPAFGVRGAPPRTAARGLAREALGLLLPTECAGCGRPDVGLCTGCVGALAGPLRRVEGRATRLDRMSRAPVLPVWSLAPYAGPVRPIVVAWKDRGRRDLTSLLGALIALAAGEVAVALREALNLARETAVSDLGPIAVVPVPSSAAARRRRGREPVPELARYVADGLTLAGLEAEPVALLAQRGGVRDQVGLSGRARAANLNRGVVVRADVLRRLRRDWGEPWRELRGVCVLVDDIVTTGASLAAAEVALAREGLIPAGAITIAATPGGR